MHKLGDTYRNPKCNISFFALMKREFASELNELITPFSGESFTGRNETFAFFDVRMLLLMVVQNEVLHFLYVSDSYAYCLLFLPFFLGDTNTTTDLGITNWDPS